VPNVLFSSHFLKVESISIQSQYSNKHTFWVLNTSILQLVINFCNNLLAQQISTQASTVALIEHKKKSQTCVHNNQQNEETLNIVQVFSE